MLTKHSYLIFILALVAGFLGGFISNQFFVPKSASAENMLRTQKIIVAEQIRVVDENGQTRAILATSKDRKGNVKVDFRLASPKSSIWLVAEDFGASLALARASAGEALHTSVRLSAHEDWARVALSQNKEKLHQEDNIELSASRRETSIYMRDFEGNTRAIIRNVPPRSLKKTADKKRPTTITLLDEKNTILWSAP